VHWIAFFFVYVLYWLPKKMIELLNMFFPQILFKNKNNIYLTFDDVPYDDQSFKNILDELQKYNVKSCHYPIDDPNNVIIIPETYEPSSVDNYKNSILV
jgi:hypothetical protein